MKLKTFVLTLKTEETMTKPTSMLRGYLVSLFPDYAFLHHHD
ncbi:MAG: hypothetical protein ACE5KE_14735, partial [Methanosarcinales archaeon]